MKACYCCGSIESIDPTSHSQHWYHNHDNSNNLLCLKCYRHLIRNPRKLKTQSIRVFMFYNRHVYYTFKQRTGYCSKCSNNIHNGSCKKTHMHHWVYLTCLPWFGREELCVSCHSRVKK